MMNFPCCNNHTVFAAVLFLGLTGLVFAQNEDLPGEAGQVNYEMAFAYLLKGDREQARAFLDQAVAAGGTYADLARLELIRLIAVQNQDDAANADVVPQIRTVLLAFEDRTLIPRAWFAAVQALEQAERRPEALALALELALRYPQSNEAAPALLSAAHLHLHDDDTDAAIDALYRILADYETSTQAREALYLLAKIYSVPGPHYDPDLACLALQHFHDHSGATLWKDSAGYMFLGSCPGRI